MPLDRSPLRLYINHVSWRNKVTHSEQCSSSFKHACRDFSFKVFATLIWNKKRQKFMPILYPQFMHHKNLLSQILTFWCGWRGAGGRRVIWPNVRPVPRKSIHGARYDSQSFLCCNIFCLQQYRQSAHRLIINESKVFRKAICKDENF